VGSRERLLERGDALDRLGTAVADASAGAGRVVAVTGEAGAGKTTLVRRFLGEAGAGLRVLWAGCDDLTVPEPLAPIRDVAAGAGTLMGEAVERGRPREIGRALLDLLARGSPGLCVIEDCHWADEATLDVLSYVTRRIGATGAVLLVTFRDDDLGLDHRLRAVVGSVPPADMVRVRLEPLSRSAVRELAGDEVDVDPLFAATGWKPVPGHGGAGGGGRAGRAGNGAGRLVGACGAVERRGASGARAGVGRTRRGRAVAGGGSVWRGGRRGRRRRALGARRGRRASVAFPA
jgi:hypothetical protein